jgi:hypothetical protein
VLPLLAALAVAGCGGGERPTAAAERETAAQVVSKPSDWFREATAEAGISTKLHVGYGHSWGDIDGDGWMDVWIVNHMYEPTVYRNNRDGTFTDITSTAWTGPTYDFHGAAWADFDNDGDQDISVLAGGAVGTKCFDKPFYVNNQGVTRNEAGLRNLNDRCGRGRTPLWLDWNSDGLLDLYIVNGRRPADLLSPSRLMLQQADGTFAELAEMQTQSAAFMAQLVHLNGRTHVLTHPGAPYPAAFHRLGDTTPLAFRVAGVPDGQLPPNISDVAVGDFDGDLQDDLFVVRTRPPGKSYRIRADGRTLDVLVKGINPGRGVIVTAPDAQVVSLRLWTAKWKPAEVRLGQAAIASNATRVNGDYNGEQLWWTELTIDGRDPNLQGVPSIERRSQRGVYIGREPDGRWSIYATGLASEELQFDFKVDQGSIGDVQAVGFAFRNNVAQRPSFLFHADGEFQDRKQAWGIDKWLSCGSVVAADFDNDMDLDLFMACTGAIHHEPNRLFENKGGVFQEVHGAGGGSLQWSEEPGGVASAVDYDQDGYMDVIVTSGCEVCGQPLRFGPRVLLKNIRSGNHWAQFDLVGCQSNRDGIGARLVVEAGGKAQMRMANGGMHAAAQDQKRVHFGLGQNTTIDRLRVEWPSGRQSVIEGLPADRIHTIHEDSSCARP